MNSSRKVILNTTYLYIKMGVSMLFTLVATRYVLIALGATDYGIFNLISGVVLMLAFLNSAMTMSSQRYMSYYRGSNQPSQMKDVFNSSVILHLIIGLIVVVILQIAGFYFFDDILNIPDSRIPSAKKVFQLLIISIFFTINSVPYDAAINANEDLIVEAIIGIAESFGRLIIAFVIYFSLIDRLVLYGLLMTFLTILVRIVKTWYCIRKYEECHFRITIPKSWALFKEMLFFGSWSTFGALCGLGRNQGIAIILNVFFGVVINAAYGIANQVNSQLMAFSMNMLKAINPQIIKSEGSGDRDRMLKLSMQASKFSFYLLALFAVPLIFEMPFVLKVWLSEVPEYTIVFCRLILIATLVNHLTIGLQTAIQATGKIKWYQIVVGGSLLLNLPIGYLLFIYGFPPTAILVSYIFIEFWSCIMRIVFLKVLAGLSILKYLKVVLFKMLIPVALGVIILLIFISRMDANIIRILISFSVYGIFYSYFFYFIGLNKNDKKHILKMFPLKKYN